MPRKITSGRVGAQVLGSLVTSDNSVQSIIANGNIILEPNGTGIVQSAAHFEIADDKEMRLSDGSTYVAFKAPAAISNGGQPVVLTMPANDGTSGQQLTTDGNGVLSWATNSLTVTNRTAADTNTYYIAMSDGTTGTEDTLSVADSNRLQFTPNPGLLTVNSIDVRSSTASSSTTTGAVKIAGGIGIGGQMTAVSIVETSSIALKENINPIQNGLESILALKGVTYDRLDNNEHESGLIAEWTEEVLPELVTRDENNSVVGIKYTKLTAYLIEAVKTLKQEIDELKNK
jgi:hypothetical protein